MTTPTTPASPDSVDRDELILGLNSAADYLIDKNMAHDASTCRKAAALLAATPAAGGGEAQPVMIYHGRCVIDCGEHGHQDVELLKLIPKGTKLYTHPQPSALPDDVVKDAERYFPYEFEVWQGDEMCASASGPREEALREAMHYAAQYGQDGPVQVFEVRRTAIDAAMLKEGK